MSFMIDPSRPLNSEISRIIREECNRAITELSDTKSDRHEALHEIRKGLKRIRALLRLIRAGDRAFSKAENARYREIAARLSHARDAGALVETVDRLANGDAAGLAALRDGLAERRDRIVGEGDDSAEMIAGVLARFHVGIKAAGSVNLADDRKKAAQILASGLERNLRHAWKSIRRAEKHGGPEDFHELRKAAKDHAMHLELAALVWPGRTTKRLSAAKKLGDKLGELNDIAVMRHVLETEGAEIAPETEIQSLQRRMKKKQKSLSRTCLANARRLFDISPGKVAKKVALNYRQAQSRPDRASSNGQMPSLPRLERSLSATDRKA